MDYEAVRAGMEAAIPYNRYLGLVLSEVADGQGVVILPQEAHLLNHVGSQHAGALFSAGEAASGAAFVGAFAERLGELTPLARTAEIEYLKLAKGPILATGTLGADSKELFSQLDANGKVEFPVNVELTDEHGQAVARMSVSWHVRRNA